MTKPGKGGGKVWRAIIRVYPEWADYLSFQADRPPAKAYAQEPEHMLPRRDHEAPDSEPGQLKLPELEKYRVVQVITPDEKWQLLNLKLDRILDRLEAVELKLKGKP